ncbi:MAG: type II toxin-antitoxin system RelE/ParE family toxin [Thainema sp.]
MRKIVVSPPARLDLRKHFDYLAENDFDKALEFFDAARQTFADLARMPGIDGPYLSENERLKDLRKWHVKGFKRHLIFYHIDKENIEIVRVLYGAQDIQSLLNGEN